MDDPILSLTDCNYFYITGKPVLTHISLDIFQGECIVLLGANGSGKTTLQKMLAGLLFPTAGEYSAFGQRITDKLFLDTDSQSAFRQRVGVLFQNSDVQLFCADVRTEILFGMRLMGLPEEECQRRADELLTLLDIRKLEKEPPHYLSGGEKKKVALAAILAVNPDVLIFDEPTNGLDPRSVRWLVSFLEELKAHGKTIIISTHHLESLPYVAHRALLFGEDHRIWYDGPVEALLADTTLLREANLI